MTGNVPGSTSEQDRLYRVIKAVATPLYRGLLRMRVEGRERRAGRGRRDRRRQPRLVLRLRRPAAVDPTAGLLHRQGRVPRLVDDPPPVPGDGADPDRPRAGPQGDGRPGGRRRRAAPRRRARHLPRGHAVARRPAAPRPHGRRPAGADVRRADRAGRARRHRPDPTGRGPGAATVPPGGRALRRAARPGGLRRLAAAAAPAAHRRPDGGDPPAHAVSRSATTSPAPSRRSCAAATRASTRCTPSAPSARRGRRRRASPSAASAGSFDDGRVGVVRRLGCRVLPDGTVRFATEMAVSVKFEPTEAAR